MLTADIIEGPAMPDFLTVSDASRELQRRYERTSHPRRSATCCTKGGWTCSACPLLGGRRLIPHDLLPTIFALLGEPSSPSTQSKGD